MPPETLFLTGATGLIGSAVLARARLEGLPVRALVRPGSTPGLDAAGVTVIRGDLSEPRALVEGLRGATLAVHCAAKVGDWGDTAVYQRANVDALRALTAAAHASVGLRRLVFLSSLGVYEARDHYGTDESEALSRRGLDPYTRSKASGELVVQAAMASGLPAVILRPGFVYGPRDRHVLPALAGALRSGRFAYFGDGSQLLDNTGVHNIVEAIFLALRVEAALGETFNITDEPLVSRRQFVETVASLLDVPAPQRFVPRPLAKILAVGCDRGARLLRAGEAPLLSMARYKFLALHLAYSIEKAKRVLGYRPRVAFADGMREAVSWFQAQERA